MQYKSLPSVNDVTLSLVGIPSCCCFIIIVTWSVPRQSFFIKLNHNLWASTIRLSCRYQVSFICSFPAQAMEVWTPTTNVHVGNQHAHKLTHCRAQASSKYITYSK